jgi:hypothetical protein
MKPKKLKKAKKAKKVKTPKVKTPRFSPNYSLGGNSETFVYTDEEGIAYHFNLNTGYAYPVKF